MVYNPSEPRDPLGKWMKAHGGNPKASLADNVKNLNYAEEHGAAVDTKNTPTAVIDQIAKTGKDEDNRLEALMNPNISDETLDSFKYSDDVRERTAVASNPKLHVCDAYTSEIATEAARNGDYDAALQIFEAGHSEWTDDRAGTTFPLSKGRMKCPAMAIDAETKLADQFLYHASSEQCEKLHELGYDSSAQGILNRFDMTNTISTRPMAEHCTVPDRLDRLSQSKDSETRLHVAGNPNTSLHTLETLSEDKDEKVSRRAVMNLEHCRENQRLSDEYAGVDFNDDSGYDDIQFEY